MMSISTGHDATSLILTHRHFSTEGEARAQQALAWRDQLVSVETALTRELVTDGFYGHIQRYQVNGLTFLDSRTDANVQTRTVARISTDTLRHYVFYIQLQGCSETTTRLHPRRQVTHGTASVLFLDMNQPLRMQQQASHILALFLPRPLVDTLLPQAEALHGRVLHWQRSPLANLIPMELLRVRRALAAKDAEQSHAALQSCATLIATAFNKQPGDEARAAVRAALIGQIRQYIEDNLYNPGLTPESVQARFALPRTTLYRLFAHEGGLAPHIRNRRLFAAATDLARHPERRIADIADSLGFKHAQDFHRAFRRAYEITPGDFRLETQQRLQVITGSLC